MRDTCPPAMRMFLLRDGLYGCRISGNVCMLIYIYILYIYIIYNIYLLYQGAGKRPAAQEKKIGQTDFPGKIVKKCLKIRKLVL